MRTGATFLLLFVIGCSAGGGGIHGTRDGGGGGTDGGGTRTDGGPGVDSGPAVDAGFMSCAATSVNADNVPRPVDIIWVIDSSGSMDGEAHIVQDNLNSFSSAIASSGIDYHVVVITSSSFVTVPAPLGTDTAHFLFLNHDIGSHEPLQGFIEYFSEYQSFLRPNASTHLIAVTDDESDLAAASFETMMSGLLGTDRADWVLHGIASENTTHSVGICPFCVMMAGCSGPNGDAANVGTQYYIVAGDRGGLTFSICTTDWSSLFTTLEATVAVVTTLPCTYRVPDPPAGMTFDRTRVNLEYTPTCGAPGSYFPYVGDAAGCSSHPDGWYYDDAAAPTQILLCPSTCTTVETGTGGCVNIALGCQTILI